MNRRILDRAIIGYKRNIYDLTPMEKLEEEDDILDLKAEEERESTINGNTIKRRRLNADDVEELED